jgi:hypothetical protein
LIFFSFTVLHSPVSVFNNYTTSSSEMSRVQTLSHTSAVDTLTTSIGKIGIRGSTVPLARNHKLDQWKSIEVTPVIGHEFGSDLQLSDVVKKDGKERDELIKDLAVLGEHRCSTVNERWCTDRRSVSQRGVVFFRSQDISVEEQKVLATKLGQVSLISSVAHS